MQALLHSVPPNLQQATAKTCFRQRLLDTQESLGQSLVGSLLLSPGAQGSVCAFPESVSPVLCKFWQLYGGLMATSSKRAYAIPRSAAPRAPILWKSTADPYLYRTRSNTVLSQFLWSLWVLMHTRFVWALWVSLAGMVFDSKCSFAPPIILLGLLLCPWMWVISSQPLYHHAAATPANFFNAWLYLPLCKRNSYSLVQFSSVAQSCLTLCDPMDCSMPGLPVHHQLMEFTQTHVPCCLENPMDGGAW